MADTNTTDNVTTTATTTAEPGKDGVIDVQTHVNVVSESKTDVNIQEKSDDSKLNKPATKGKETQLSLLREIKEGFAKLFDVLSPQKTASESETSESDVVSKSSETKIDDEKELVNSVKYRADEAKIIAEALKLSFSNSEVQTNLTKIFNNIKSWETIESFFDSTASIIADKEKPGIPNKEETTPENAGTNETLPPIQQIIVNSGADENIKEADKIAKKIEEAGNSTKEDITNIKNNVEDAKSKVVDESVKNLAKPVSDEAINKINSDIVEKADETKKTQEEIAKTTDKIDDSIPEEASKEGNGLKDNFLSIFKNLNNDLGKLKNESILDIVKIYKDTLKNNEDLSSSEQKDKEKPTINRINDKKDNQDIKVPLTRKIVSSGIRAVGKSIDFVGKAPEKIERGIQSVGKGIQNVGKGVKVAGAIGGFAAKAAGATPQELTTLKNKSAIGGFAAKAAGATPQELTTLKNKGAIGGFAAKAAGATPQELTTLKNKGAIGGFAAKAAGAVTGGIIAGGGTPLGGALSLIPGLQGVRGAIAKGSQTAVKGVFNAGNKIGKGISSVSNKIDSGIEYAGEKVKGAGKSVEEKGTIIRRIGGFFMNKANSMINKTPEKAQTGLKDNPMISELSKMNNTLNSILAVNQGGLELTGEQIKNAAKAEKLKKLTSSSETMKKGFNLGNSGFNLGNIFPKIGNLLKGIGR